MLTIYNWKIRRSGTGMTVFGIAVDAAHTNHEYRLTGVSQIALGAVAGDIIAFDDNHVAIAVLSKDKYGSK